MTPSSHFSAVTRSSVRWRCRRRGRTARGGCAVRAPGCPGAGCGPTAPGPAGPARVGGAARGKQGIGVEALLELDADHQGARQEVGFRQALVVAPHPLEVSRHAFVQLDEALVAGGHLVEGPQPRRDEAGVALTTHLEVVAGRHGHVLGYPQPRRLGHDVVVPGVRGDVQAVVDRGAAHFDQVVAEGVACRSLGLRDGERYQAPRAIPSASGGILRVGQARSVHGGGEHPQAGRGGSEDGFAAVAFPGEQTLGPEAAKAGSDLVGRQPAGIGHRVELLGADGAIVVCHPEHQDPSGDLDPIGVGTRAHAGLVRLA